MSRRGNRRARTSKRTGVCEPLESRRLLSTYVINGTNGSDSWYIEADPGQIYVGGQLLSAPGLTDVQVNGFDGDDTLVIGHTTVPIVFNCGVGNSLLSLTSGLLSGQILSTVTFNAGFGNYRAEARDELWPSNTTYSFSGNQLSWGTGSLVWNNFISLTLNTGYGSNSTYVNTSINSPANITINGNHGSDYVFVDLASAFSAVNVNGGSGGGFHRLEVSDYNVGGSVIYTVTQSRISRAGRAVNYSGMESVQFQGGGFFPCEYNVTSSPGGVPLSILGGLFNDTFNLRMCNQFTFGINGPVSVYGFGGSDTLNCDGSLWQGTPLTFWLTPTSVSINSPTPLVSYQAIAALNLYGPNGVPTSDCSYVVTGTASSITSQTTIFAGTGNNDIYIHPHDAQGNLTIATNLGIGGGSGSDRVIIEDTPLYNPLDLPINYTFSNPFGPGTQNIAGMGAGLVGAASDVESLHIYASNGNDTFRVDQFQSGSALALYGGDGDDACTLGTGDMSATLTNCSAFTFDGQGGVDRFTIANGLTNITWGYTVITGAITAQSNSGYLWHSVTPNIESQYILAGPFSDTFRVDSTAAGVYTECHGGAGVDRLQLGAGPQSLEGIRGHVRFNTGTDGGAITASDVNDTTGDIFHLDANSLGAYAGDNLFGSGGFLTFAGPIVNWSGVAGGIDITLGTGADTVYAHPQPTARVNIFANDPASAPGDTLNLAIAAVENASITGTPASGSLTSTSHQALNWFAFEGSVQTDNVAPAMVAADINLNGIPGPGDSVVNRQSLDIQFSEDVSGRLNPSWLQLTNTTTMQPVPTANIAVEWEAATNTAHFTFPGYPQGILPDGDYSGKILAGLPDFFGNGLPADAPFTFFFLQADANHDRRVNLQDFNILAANFGLPDRTFSQGDFNYDGQVTLADFNILAGRFGLALGPDGGMSPGTQFGQTLIRTPDRLIEVLSELA